MVDLILRNAVVVTADAERRVIRDGAVAVEGGRIARVGTAEEIGAEARSVVDAGGMLLMPGLINTHCHAADSLFRGLVEDLPLEPWLRKVWKAEAATLDPRTVRLGATLGLAELLLGGVTTVMDMFWHPRETVAAARDLGMRVSTGGIFFDGPGIDGLGPAERMAQAGAFFDDFADAPDLGIAVGAHEIEPRDLAVGQHPAEVARRVGTDCAPSFEEMEPLPHDRGGGSAATARPPRRPEPAGANRSASESASG